MVTHLLNKFAPASVIQEFLKVKNCLFHNNSEYLHLLYINGQLFYPSYIVLVKFVSFFCCFPC